MTKLFLNVCNSKNGASAAEYALIIAVVGGLVVSGVTALGGSFKTALTTSGNYLTTSATNGAK